MKNTGGLTKRDANGRFVAGNISNPEGTNQWSEKSNREIRDETNRAIAVKAPCAVARLWEIAENPETPPNIRVQIYALLTEKTVGKAVQPLCGETEDGEQTGLSVTVNIVDQTGKKPEGGTSGTTLE